MASIFNLIVYFLMKSHLEQAMAVSNSNLLLEQYLKVDGFKNLRTVDLGVEGVRTVDMHELPPEETYGPIYQTLENFEVEAAPTSEMEHPWIARVVHSPYQHYPFVCTATCIEPQIFITSASCLNSLKIAYTSVIYEKRHFRVKIFVLPYPPTRMQFDDIGFIIVEPTSYKGNWPLIELSYIPTSERGEGFQWFADLGYENNTIQHKVIGYASKKFYHTMKSPTTEFRLVELPVVVGIDMCQQILGSKDVQGYRVPCYLSCTLQEFQRDDPKCKKYLGTEGGAIVNFRNNKLLGIATWTVTSKRVEVPVGFSVPNSETFFENLECAMRLRDDTKVNVSAGYYQSLCPKKSDK